MFNRYRVLNASCFFYALLVFMVCLPIGQVVYFRRKGLKSLCFQNI